MRQLLTLLLKKESKMSLITCQKTISNISCLPTFCCIFQPTACTHFSLTLYFSNKHWDTIIRSNDSPVGVKPVFIHLPGLNLQRRVHALREAPSLTVKPCDVTIWLDYSVHSWKMMEIKIWNCSACFLTSAIQRATENTLQWRLRSLQV